MIKRIQQARLAAYQQDGGWQTFGDGWTRRLNGIALTATAWAAKGQGIAALNPIAATKAAIGEAVMFSKIIIGIVTFAMLCAMAWFGVPRVIMPAWTHIMDGEAALRAQPGLMATIAQDKADASSSAKTCDARVHGAYSAAARIARIAAPRAPPASPTGRC